jgi:polyisoprenoid-binding protein YceI
MTAGKAQSATITGPFAAGRWQAVTPTSTAGFAVRNFGGANTVQGTLPVVAAWVEVDPSGEPIAVHAELDLAAIDTKNARRDRDLRKPRLLDTAQQPTLTFVGGTPVRFADHWELAGHLIGKATVDMVLVVQVVVGESGDISVRATGTFDRQDLGVKAPAFMIGRQIDVTIEAIFQPPVA